MDDFLRACLPVNVAPMIMTHLPELDVTQPDKVCFDCPAVLIMFWTTCVTSTGYQQVTRVMHAQC